MFIRSIVTQHDSRTFLEVVRSIYVTGISVYLLIVATWQLPQLGCGRGMSVMKGPSEVPHAGASPSFGPSLFRRSRVALSLGSKGRSTGAFSP